VTTELTDHPAPQTDLDLVVVRQVSLGAADYDTVVGDLAHVFGGAVVFHDPEVEQYGLRNAIVRAGDQFLEVVSPITDDAAIHRFLGKREAAAGGYSLILQVTGQDGMRQRAADLGMREILGFTAEGFTALQWHPNDAGGTMLEADEQEGHDPQGPWRPAGYAWPDMERGDLRGFVEIGVTAVDPVATAERWGQVLGRASATDPEIPDGAVLPIDGARVVFRPSGDAVPGLSWVVVRTSDAAAALARADERGVRQSDTSAVIGGLRFDIQQA
jgi:hypothetical protein